MWKSVTEKSKGFPVSPYLSFSFLLNATCASALLVGDIWFIVKRWNVLSEDKIVGFAFWVGIIATAGPFLYYAQTYRELDILDQLNPTSLPDGQIRNLAEGLRIAKRALDNLLLQYFAVIFILTLCIAKVLPHR